MIPQDESWDDWLVQERLRKHRTTSFALQPSLREIRLRMLDGKFYRCSSPGPPPISVPLKKGVVLALSAETAACYIKAQFTHGHLIVVVLLTGLPLSGGATSLLEM